jgi:hypothetical protein
MTNPTVGTGEGGFAVRRYGPGETPRAGDYRRGDFVLTRGQGFISWLIRFGQGLGYWGPERKYTYWSHTALFVDEEGTIVEALGRGVVRSHIDKYLHLHHHVVALAAVTPEEREHEVRFAEYCVVSHSQYGFVTIVSIVLSLLTGMKFGFGIDGQEICSGLVSRALERTGAIFPEEPWHMMPADLARRYQVDPPPS